MRPCKHATADLPVCAKCDKKRARSREIDRARYAKRKAYYEANKPKILAANKAYAHAHHDDILPRKRLLQRLRKGILDAERVPEILAKQGWKCGICTRTSPGGRGDWHADHDPSTGFLRGVLCMRCNQSLGMFGDTVEGLERAVAYLKNPPALEKRP